METPEGIPGRLLKLDFRIHTLAELASPVSPRRLYCRWTPEEDHALETLIEAQGAVPTSLLEWEVIAEGIAGRSGKQCRVRWKDHLEARVRQQRLWRSREEEARLLVVQMRLLAESVAAACTRSPYFSSKTTPI